MFKRILGALDEPQRRWLVGREALRFGRDGIQRMLEVSGLSKTTILERIKELHSRRANRRLLEHEIVISCLLSKNLSAGPFSVPSVFSV
ncbi:MAG: hypothetical protein ABSF73_10085 [Terriglobia bacterium]